MIELGGLAFPGLPYPVVHLPHSVDHLVGPLPFGKELPLHCADEHQHQVSRPEYTQLCSSVVDRRLGLLDLPEVVPDDGPNLCPAVPHLLHMVQYGAVWRRLALPRLLGEV